MKLIIMILHSVAFPLPPDNMFDSTPIRYHKYIIYEGVQVKVQVKYSPDTIGVFCKPDLTLQDNYIDLTCSLGFINYNGNLCRSKNLSERFKHDSHLVGIDPLFKDYKGKLTDYIKQNELIIGVKITRIDRSVSLTAMVHTIYNTLNTAEQVKLQKELESLRNSVLILQGQNDRLNEEHRVAKTTITSLEEQNISLRDELNLAKTTLASIGTLNGEASLSSLLALDLAIQGLSNTETKETKAEPTEDIKLRFKEFIETVATTPVLYDFQKMINETLTEKLQCDICRSNNKDCTLDPCGHVYCRICASKFTTCPSCRTVINARKIIYF